MIMDWKNKYKDKLIAKEEAAGIVRAGDTITVNICDNCPYLILNALADRLDEDDALTDLTVSGLGITKKPVRLYDPKYAGRIKFIDFFWGPQERKAQAAGARFSYQPVHLSYRWGDMVYGRKSRIYIAAASAPDGKGRVSLGPNPVDTDLLSNFDIVIIQINEKLPFVCGESCMYSLDRADYIVDGPEDIVFNKSTSPNETDAKIARYVVERVEDGSCIQLGIGGLGTAIGTFLKEKKHLGIHTEIFVDAFADLIECGAADNSRKNLKPGKSEFGFALLSDKVYNCLDNNPDVEGNPFSWINDPRIISQNDNVVSINSAMEIDLTGQVAAEGMGMRHFSGTGGQADFVRGARWSKGGKSFICIPSSRTDKQGALHSKISLGFAPGTPVTTPRADVQYIVTEYGIAYLEYASVSERAQRLIAIAHPQFRDELTFEAKKAGLI